MTLKELNSVLEAQLVSKIEDEIKVMIEPKVKEMAKELASNIHTVLIYENHFMDDRLKIDISENKTVKGLEQEVKRLKSILAQNGIR